MYIRYTHKFAGDISIWEMSDNLALERFIYNSVKYQAFSKHWTEYDWQFDSDAFYVDVLTDEEAFLEMI